ncbi:MAG: hypothetical protein M3Y35_18030 [Actinomycetota bacterium]|nr:hypothetical protein [Actinomycetota bacterium]
MTPTQTKKRPPAAKPRRQKHARTQEQWLDAEEVPRAGMPDAAKMARRRRVYRWLVNAIVFVLFPVACLGMIVSATQSAAPAATTGSAVQADSPGRSAATLAVQSWLAGTPSPLPGGAMVAWTGAKKIDAAPPLSASDTAPTFATEIDTFTVVSQPSGALFDVAVQVAVDPRGGAAVISEPSAVPAEPISQDGWNTGATWPGYKDNGPVSDSVTTAIKAWATAFTGGDPDALRVAVGDPDPTHVYVPLAGIQSVTADTSSTMQPRTAKGPVGDRLVARVTLGVLWQGQVLADQQQPGQMSYDVLIERASTAAPLVTAWGAPGSGPDLSPYGNSMARPDMTAVAAPSVSASTGGTEPSGGPSPAATTRPVAVAPTTAVKTPAKKPAVTKPAPTKAAPKKPAVTKPAPTKAAPKKPAAGTPTSTSKKAGS